MRIFGLSLTTIILVVVAIYVGKKFGSVIPLVNKLP